MPRKRVEIVFVDVWKRLRTFPSLAELVHWAGMILKRALLLGRAGLPSPSNVAISPAQNCLKDHFRSSSRDAPNSAPLEKQVSQGDL